ncbi:hypothetical protein [Adhaeretor mobilis]|uniref:hypothetical protein n=1 Tax=Adhaeretor mobilis TaxID=1930276 RepID=UPI0011A0C7B1|nr:hypothetical protein [Adhaeretor mobilis]
MLTLAVARLTQRKQGSPWRLLLCDSLARAKLSDATPSARFSVRVPVESDSQSIASYRPLYETL